MPVLAGIFWGSVGIFVRILTDFGMDNYTVLGSRMAVAVVILFFVILFRDKSLFRIRIRDLGLFLGSGACGLVALNYCYNEAINHLTLSLAAVLLSLSPIFVMIMSAVLFHERITLKKIGCTALAIAGCVLVSGVLQSGGVWNLRGVFLGVCSAFCYGVYSVISKEAMQRGYDTFTILFYSILTAVIILIPLVEWNVFRDFLQVAPVKNSLFMILHALCNSILPYFFYTWSINRIEVGKVSIITAGGEPSAAMMFGLIFFGEWPSLLSFGGMVLTIFALSILCAPEKKALDAKITEYNRYLSNEGGMYETEALEEAMQKVMDEYAGGISTHYQFNEKQLALAKEKIEKIEKLAENVNAGDMHELMFVYELKERLTVCKSVIAHLFARKETRWHSFDENLDYPKKSGDWLKYVNSKMEDGKITVFTRKLVGREEHYEHHDESGAL